MSSILRTLDKLENLPKVLIGWMVEILTEDKTILEELNKDQMYSGRNREGALITPGYSDDPYFTSSVAADRYAQMKSRLSVRNRQTAESIFGSKPYDTPDLIITGKLVYDRLIVNVTPEQIIFDLPTPINDKYGGMLEGLSDVGWEYYREEYFLPKLRERIDAWIRE